MKWIVFFLLPLSALADSRFEYETSCRITFRKIITRTQPGKMMEAVQLGRDSCPEMAEKMATDGNPRLNACMDVIYVLSNGAPLADRKQMAAVYCF